MERKKIKKKMGGKSESKWIQTDERNGEREKVRMKEKLLVGHSLPSSDESESEWLIQCNVTGNWFG